MNAACARGDIHVKKISKTISCLLRKTRSWIVFRMIQSFRLPSICNELSSALYCICINGVWHPGWRNILNIFIYVCSWAHEKSICLGRWILSRGDCYVWSEAIYYLNIIILQLWQGLWDISPQRTHEGITKMGKENSFWIFWSLHIYSAHTPEDGMRIRLGKLHSIQHILWINFCLIMRFTHCTQFMP